MMVQVLEFIFSDAWHFLGTLVILFILAMWKPIDITIINGRVEKKPDE